jgi:XTP/dITP diphosphohydrolase
MNRLLLATHNKHKAEELQALLREVDVEVLTLDAFPQVGDIEEDADTLEGNALKKAREVFRQTSLPSLADDTGLEVEALNGAPGVLSSRYAGPNATYADNVATLLRDMQHVPAEQRTARFRCVLAFVAPNGVEEIVEGVCQGTITREPRGIGGFGYDPIFLPDGHQLTFAEMPMEVKNTISHRARALARMKSVLIHYFAHSSK